MARTMKVVLTDDIDGTPADETVEFALDGTDYEIELNSDNAAKFREVLEPYISKARRVSGSRASKKKATTSRFDPVKVRDWARDNGFEVSERGRLSSEVIEAYEKSLTN